MTYEDRIAKNSQWREDAAFLGRAILGFHLENLPRIRQIIEAYPGKTRENRDNRKYGYLALVRHLKHFPDPDYMRWHIAQIPKETDKYLLSWMMCEIKDWPYLPVDIDITPLLDCTRDERWLVRQGAVWALSLSDTDTAREAVRLFLRLEPIRKNEPDYMYVCDTLSKIGTPDDLPVLETLYQRANRNLKYTFSCTIKNIKERYQIETD